MDAWLKRCVFNLDLNRVNCLEMMAVFRALKHFLPDLRDRHVFVRTDNTALVFYLNHQGGLSLCPLFKLAHQILVWSQGKLLSLRAVHIPGHLNMGADILSRQGLRPGEWMLHPEVVNQIMRVFGYNPVLAGPSMVLKPDFSPRRLSMGDSHQKGSPLTGRGHDLSPLLGVVEAVGVDPEVAQLMASGLSTEVVETILQSRAPLMRKLYALDM